MIFAIISAWLAYKKAKATNRNALLWAFIAAATFIGTQLVTTFALGVALGLGIGFFGWSPDILDSYNIPITILAVVTSFGSTWLVLRYLDKIPEEQTFTEPPPPPTDFNLKN
jgi:membrane protein insertase Oxa1/YidC/SpoIIIJ